MSLCGAHKCAKAPSKESLQFLAHIACLLYPNCTLLMLKLVMAWFAMIEPLDEGHQQHQAGRGSRTDQRISQYIADWRCMGAGSTLLPQLRLRLLASPCSSCLIPVSQYACISYRLAACAPAASARRKRTAMQLELLSRRSRLWRQRKVTRGKLEFEPAEEGAGISQRRPF